MRILIVEQDTILADGLAQLLCAHDHEIVGPAYSAEDALALICKPLPMLALVDLGLEGKTDGVVLGAMLRERWRIPSILITAQSDARPRANGVALGLIAKPVSEETVVKAVEWFAALRSGAADVAAPPELVMFDSEGGFVSDEPVPLYMSLIAASLNWPNRAAVA